MSRSRRKTPITGITMAESEKQDKRIWHKRHRQRLKENPYADEKEVSGAYGQKDGKQYLGNKHPELMRK